MEIWKNIQGYEGSYQISNRGRVKSLSRKTYSGRKRNRTRKEIFIKPNIDKDGYFQVHLSKDGIKTAFKVSRLVAIAFKPNPQNLPQVNHLDGIKTNNHDDNLEWTTNSGNVEHAFRIGLNSNRGDKNSNSKLTWLQVQVIREAIRAGYQQKGVASYFAVSAWTISMINTGRIWRQP